MKNSTSSSGQANVHFSISVRDLLHSLSVALATSLAHLIAAVVILSAGILIGCSDDSDVDAQLENSLFLLNLPANRWVKYHELKGGDWWRKGHAGLAYDSSRGSLLVFGSDTHGEDWDNVIHEFIPRQRTWVHHGVNAHQSTYKVSAEGYAVAGDTDVQPWAMHTYDGVDYVPIRDAVVVVASPNHNPILKQRPKPSSSAIWLYDLKTKTWSVLAEQRELTLFGAATAYDETDDNLFICKAGLWVLNIKQDILERIARAPECLHRNMAFDSWRRHIYLFGSYQRTCKVLRFDFGFVSDRPKEWEELSPGGDHCPPYGSVPVAFDEKLGVFLLVVDEPGSSKDQKPSTAKTLVYKPETNTYETLPGAQLPAVGMNFMMAWDKIHEVFFLLTGSWKDGMTVWVLKLSEKGQV